VKKNVKIVKGTHSYFGLIKKVYPTYIN